MYLHPDLPVLNFFIVYHSPLPPSFLFLACGWCTAALKRGSTTSHSRGGPQNDFPPKGTIQKGGNKVPLQWKNLANTTSASPVIGPISSIYL